LSEFGGSAWAFDEASGQYYYHAFLSAQPDLNWRNRQVRAAMHDVMRFWLKRGVDGFRVDVIWHLIKDAMFRDNPTNPDFRDDDLPYRRFLPVYSTDRDEVHEVIRELRAVADEFPERLLIGEIYLPLDRLVTYYGHDLGGAHLPFNFSLIETPWNALAIASLIDRYEELLPHGAWPNWVLGNHDRPRAASRIGERHVRLAAMLLLTLRGTPTLYYGDEIGLPQVTILPEQVRDPAIGLGRDGCRTPMQWDASAFSGFSSATPWLPQSMDAASRNVASQRADFGSLYNLYRRLIAARRASAALARGSYRRLAATDEVLSYLREAGDQRVMVALNFGTKPAAVPVPGGKGTILVFTDPGREPETAAGSAFLPGGSGVVIALGC
jgi:alpha-glucosidase